MKFAAKMSLTNVNSKMTTEETENHHLNSDCDDVEDEELITAQKVLERLQTAWKNERLAPEILPPQTDMLELMLGQISHMEENMRDLDKNDFRYIAHRMELDRIRYIISSYLRCRLQKIELYAQYILMEENERDSSEKRLTTSEQKFAEEYVQNEEAYFHEVALKYLPNMPQKEAMERIVRPNLMSHVFIKANVSVPAVVVGVDDEEVDLAVGSQHIIPYQLISDLILKDKAELI